MINFARILDRILDTPPTNVERKRTKKRKKRLSAQAQKYALVPQWRRRPGGKKGQMK